MKRALAMGLGSLLTYAGCAAEAPDGPGARHVKIRLEASESPQTLHGCDAAGVCQVIPNPDGCAVLLVTVDSRSGEVCERCEDGAGQALYDRCTSTSVDCVRVTVSEPDCFVCAHASGPVLYSTCEPVDSGRCIARATASGSCRVCVDGAGRTILDECDGHCRGLVCPMLRCESGFVPARRPGGCCDTCLPAEPCGGMTCASEAVPVCPPGTSLARDPADCCSFTCMPSRCRPLAPCVADGDCGPGFACEGGGCAPLCPDGFGRDPAFPACHGCVPAPEPVRYCAAETDCGGDEVCASLEDCLQPRCEPPESCSGLCAGGVCPCLGICRPREQTQCRLDFPDPGACEGRHASPGTDAFGCPLAPVCVCPGGLVSLDGHCPDLCEGFGCPVTVHAPVCSPGTHYEFGYPYCCGVCVPDDRCWTDADSCLAVDCAPGMHCIIGPKCEPRCVPDLALCAASADCAPGQTCTTERGDCLPPPGCDPQAGVGCIDLCYGVCVPLPCTADAGCPLGFHCDPAGGLCQPNDARYCMASSECGASEVCTTEQGECLPAPACDPASTAGCLDVCYGLCRPAGCFTDGECPSGSLCEGEVLCPPGSVCSVPDTAGVCTSIAAPCTKTDDCEPPEFCSSERDDCSPPPDCDPLITTCPCWGVCMLELCDAAECGPTPTVTARLCADGRSFSGPTGRCLADAGHVCTWEILSCP